MIHEDRKSKCLYCLRSDRDFKSIEHTIPRGLGNDDVILDRGIVCDTCNNGILSSLDTVLLDFEPIKFFRSFHGLKSRKGNYVQMRQPSFRMSHDTQSHINVEVLDSARGAIKTRGLEVDINMKSAHKVTPEYLKTLARSLYKIGLGLIYIDLGAEEALSVRFDKIRKIILGEKDFSGELIFTRHPEVRKEAYVRHWDQLLDGEMISFFRFYYYGLEIHWEMEHRKLKLPPDFPKNHVDVVSF